MSHINSSWVAAAEGRTFFAPIRAGMQANLLLTPLVQPVSSLIELQRVVAKWDRLAGFISDVRCICAFREYAPFCNQGSLRAPPSKKWTNQNV